MTRKTITAASMATIILATGACNTVQGLGRDIESVGREGEEIISYAPPAQQRDAQETQAAR